MTARPALLVCLVALLVTLPARAGAVDPEATTAIVSVLAATSSAGQHSGSVGGAQVARSTHRKLLGENRIQNNCRRRYSRWCR